MLGGIGASLFNTIGSKMVQNMGTGVGLFGKEGGFMSNFGTGGGALQGLFGDEGGPGVFGKLANKGIKALSTNQGNFGSFLNTPNINPAPGGGGTSGGGGQSLFGQNILRNLGSPLMGGNQYNAPNLSQNYSNNQSLQDFQGIDVFNNRSGFGG